MRPPHLGTEEAQSVSEVQVSRGAWAYERGRLWVMELDGDGYPPALIQPDIAANFSEVTREPASTLAAAMELPGLETIQQRFAAGRRCFAAWVQEEIATYCWFSQTPECIGEMEREIKIPADEAYIWDCATVPAFRRKNLYNALLGRLALHLKAEGLRRVWIGSSLENHPSQRAFMSAGFRPVVTALYARLYNLSCMAIFGTSDAPKELVDLARQRLARRHERSWGPILLSFSGPVYLPACVQM